MSGKDSHSPPPTTAAVSTTNDVLGMWGQPAAIVANLVVNGHDSEEEEEEEEGMMEHHSSCEMLAYLTEMKSAGYSNARGVAAAAAGGGGGGDAEGMGRRLGSYASASGTPEDKEPPFPAIAGTEGALAVKKALDDEDFSDLLAEGQRFAMEAAKEEMEVAEVVEGTDGGGGTEEKQKEAPMTITFHSSVNDGTTRDLASLPAGGGTTATTALTAGGGTTATMPFFSAEEIIESRSCFTQEFEILEAIFDPDQIQATYSPAVEGASYLQSVRIQILPQSTLEIAFKVRNRKSDGLTLNIFWRQGYPEHTGPEITIEPWHNLLTREEVDTLYRTLAVEATGLVGTPMVVTLCGSALSLVEEAVSKPEGLSFIPQAVGAKIRENIGHGRDNAARFAPSQYIGNVADLLVKIPREYDVVNVENILKEDLAERFDKMQRFFYKKHCEKFESGKNKHLRGTKWVQERAEITPAFHGTRNDTIGRIVRNGLLVPGSQTGLRTRVGSRYGNGIYNSPDPGLALSYAETGRDNAASIKLLITAVLLGNKKTIYDGEEPWGGGCTPGFESHVSEDGSQYCVFHEWQVLPCYVIHLMRRSYKDRDSSLRGITSKQDAEMTDANHSRGSHLDKDDTGGLLAKKEKQRILTAMARKNLPLGFGPAGDKFVVEDIARYSDDEEDWGEYQAQLRGGGHDAPEVTEAYEEFQHESLLTPSIDPNRSVTVYEMNKGKTHPKKK